jgi:superfamily II DNA helicase RecQ
MQGLGQLDRIVVDECHTPLESTPDFRPEMRDLGKLVEREVQVVFLTATLPPHRETEFMNIMKVRAEDVHIFRAPTSRPNIEYSVFEYDGEEEGEAVCTLVQEKLHEYPAPAKIIVYSSDIERVQQLSQALDCHAYYRDVGNAQVKDETRKA